MGAIASGQLSEYMGRKGVIYIFPTILLVAYYLSTSPLNGLTLLHDIEMFQIMRKIVGLLQVFLKFWFMGFDCSH